MKEKNKQLSLKIEEVFIYFVCVLITEARKKCLSRINERTAILKMLKWITNNLLLPET